MLGGVNTKKTTLLWLMLDQINQLRDIFIQRTLRRSGLKLFKCQLSSKLQFRGAADTDAFCGGRTPRLRVPGRRAGLTSYA